jgi:hypothetical protein
MEIKKNLIQEAILQAKEIEKFALDKTRQALEEELAPKIKQITNEALKGLEKDTLQESVSIEISKGEDVNVKVAGETEIPSVENLSNEPEIPNSEEVSSEEDITSNIEDMDEIYEIEGLNEDDALPVQPTTTEPAVDAAPEMGAPTDTTPEGPATLDSINQKLDMVLSKIDSESGDTGMPNAEGEVEIVDDEQNAAPAPAPAPVSQAPAPALQETEYELDESPDEEIVYEMEDDENPNEDIMYEFETDSAPGEGSSMGIFNEMDNLDEIEIVDEYSKNEGEQVDEMLGASFSAQKRTERRQHPATQKGTHAPEAPLSQVALKENKNIKTQNESKFDGLKKENESLKKSLKEYKESFITLRKQINEVQVFNSKLAYANKLFTNGGLSNDEKVRIAEEFDKVNSAEGAKKLYNKFLNEMKTPSTKSTIASKLSSANPAVISTKVLNESSETSRMKELAGITKKREE